MRFIFIIICLLISILSIGMTFSPTTTTISYNNLKLGDSYDEMIQYFGSFRYSENEYLWGQKVTYYIYKNNNKIGINNDTKKIVDIIIVDDTYNHNDKLKIGTTSYKIEQIFGKSTRQLIDGKTCYAYQDNNNHKIILQIEPTNRHLETFRLTSLPLDLPEDKTAYVPDNATDESENPLIADKEIDTSAITSDKADDKFQIKYNYSITK